MNILIAIDGSEHTAKALDFLAAQRTSLVDGNRLTVVHVAPGIPAHVTRHLSKAAVDEFYAEECAKVVDPVRDALDALGIAPDAVLIRHGAAAQGILEAATETQAQMIVMGTHGHGFFGRALMGSVATKVVSESELPVLLVR